MKQAVRFRREWMIVTTAVSALCSATAAHAQPGQASPSNGDLSAQAPGAMADGTGYEIVVTAQKRPEILQDVPISISVVTGDALRQTGATQLVDVSGYVPGLQVDSLGTPGQTTITLRGVSPLTATPTVGIYVDDTPVGSSSLYGRGSIFSLDLLPYDIERIEILRGPQGTLYGASSIGGLVKYVTVAPSLNRTSGRLGGEIFDIDSGRGVGYGVQGLINTPLAQDRVGLSASFAYRAAPGYVDNVRTGRRDQNDYDQIGARVGLLARPTDRFSVRFSAIYQRLDSDNNAQVIEDLATGRRLGDGYATDNFLDEPFNKEFQYISGSFDYDFGFATLTSATSYSRTETEQTIDASQVYGTLFPLLTGGAAAAGVSPFELTLDQDKFTQEVRLTSPSGGGFDWLIGGFYTFEDSVMDQFVPALTLAGAPIPGLNPLVDISLPTKYREYAIFGNATLHLADWFDLTGGMRWAHNSQTFRQISSGALLPVADTPGRSSEDVFTFSLSPQFHLTPDVMLYGRIASGYLPGGPNVNLPNVPPQVGSSTLTSYEIGLKGTFADPRLAFEIAAYQLEWDDIQLTQNFGGTSAAVNGGGARSQGIEASLILQPFTGLRLAVNGSYVNARLTDDAPEIGGVDGDRLPNSPRWSGSLTADYTFDVGANQASVGLGVRHIGRRLSLVESATNSVPADAYTTLEANAAIMLGQNWRLRVYGRNLTGSQGAVSRTLQTNGLLQPVRYVVIPVQPRTVGLAVEFSF